MHTLIVFKRMHETWDSPIHISAPAAPASPGWTQGRNLAAQAGNHQQKNAGNIDAAA